jgi:two-component system sensor histidine kinase KdpD
MFAVSRALATRASTGAVLPAIGDTLAREAQMDGVWFALGADDAEERASPALGEASRPPQFGRYAVLRRMPGDVPAAWVQIHDPPAAKTASRPRLGAFRVRIEAGGGVQGSIWGVRDRGAGEPDGTQSRLLAAAADQIGQALVQDRLAADARQAEIARQSDALKSALLESVSHDLRTPLASIRAAAGTLMDPSVLLDRDEALASAASIDRQAERLNRLVANLLDLGRIEGGALRTSTEVIDLEDLVARAVAAVPRRSGDPSVELELGIAPTVEADPVLLEEALVNVLDNAVRHTPAGTRIRVGTSTNDQAAEVRLTVDDSGPGVADEALPHLFERFHRGSTRGAASSAGIGIGLAVVRGLVEAMGGRATGRRSELGGLAIDIDLPVPRLPIRLESEAHRVAS